MISIPAKGHCQCGTVRFEVTDQPFVQYTCHCTECQKLSASAFNTCIQVPAESVVLSSGQPKSQVRTADSGNRLITQFCGDCGTALYAQNSVRPKLRTIYVGALERPQDIEINAHIWLHSKLPWVVIPPDHRRFERAGDWSQDFVNAQDRFVP